MARYLSTNLGDIDVMIVATGETIEIALPPGVTLAVELVDGIHILRAKPAEKKEVESVVVPEPVLQPDVDLPGTAGAGDPVGRKRSSDPK